MTTSNLLTPGDAFPPLTLSQPGGSTLALPLAGEHTVVLFYRGSWCPYCNAQLRAFQRASDKLAEDGAVLVSVYSSNAIGRLEPDDVIGFIRYVREHERAAA